MTSIKQQMEDAQLVKELWDALLPTCPAPAIERIMLWVGQFDEHVIQRGVHRAAAKRHKCPTMTAEDCARYATSVMKNEQRTSKREVSC